MPNLKIAACDFEAFYDKKTGFSIGGMGLEKYLLATDIYLVAIVGNGGERYVGNPREFVWSSLLGYQLWSHNRTFDKRAYFHLRMKVLADVMNPVDLADWPHPDEFEWHCTADLAAYHRGGRSLKKSLKNLLGRVITKDVRDAMSGVRWADTLTMPPITPNAGFANFREEIIAYADSDAVGCLDLALAYSGSWPEMEVRLSDLTAQGCHTGLPLDVPALEAGKAMLETKIWEVEKKLPWVAGLYQNPARAIVVGGLFKLGWPCLLQPGQPALSPKGLAEACRIYGIPHPPSTAEDDARCIMWENEYGAKYPWVGDMRERRKANILLQRANVLLDRQVDGRFHYELKYGGAHTLRWSGGREKEKGGDAGKGFNVQNMPKKPAFGFDLRACIKAPPGKKLIIADLAQIEARITPYLAGDSALIQLICDGMNVYEAHARLTMGYCINEKLKLADPDLYALAKARVLALGFGCGWMRFRDQAQLDYGVGLDWPAAKWKEQVRDYRASNPKIERLWNRLNNDFRDSLGGNYEIEMASGRILTYYDVSTGEQKRTVAEPKEGEATEYTRQSFKARVEIGGPFKWMYGGLLTENWVQAEARDVFGAALLRVADERPDLEYLWPTHDEGVWLADEDDDTAKRDVEELLSVTPPWLPGCPIGAEVVETLYYEK